MLHIVNKSPFENRTLDSCLRIMGKDQSAALLLTEDAVFAATKGNVIEGTIKDAMGKIKIYALWPDVEARGMQDRVLEGIKMVDYGGFVDLVVEHSNCQSWL
ncbi:MAG: sulfurtransferase complex subunit TusB [Burkholderiales bacterium]